MFFPEKLEKTEDFHMADKLLALNTGNSCPVT